MLDGLGFTCSVKDISVGGAAIYTDAPVSVGGTAVLHIGDLGAFNAEVVHRNGHRIGFKFLVVDRKKQEQLIEYLSRLMHGGV